MPVDLFSALSWECRPAEPGSASGPDDLVALENFGWRPAQVPGTAAGALRSAGEDPDSTNFDAFDWWFHSRFERPAARGPYVIEFAGLATIADVWLNDRHVLHAENMFRSYEVETDWFAEQNDFWIRFASLDVALEGRKKRPRWKTYLVAHQNLRFVRTTLLGRMRGWAVTPAPVGPYRPVKLFAAHEPRLVRRQIFTSVEDRDGLVRVELTVRGIPKTANAKLRVEESEVALDVNEHEGDLVLRGVLKVGAIETWWPHTHGPQPLYRASVEIDGEVFDLGRIGFRTIELDRSDGDFRLSVNGEPIFCRGAVWMPVDPVSLAPTVADVRATLELAKAANLNLIRLPGTGVYQDESFWDACDELGLLVWQECMLAFSDPPDEPSFVSELESELVEQFELISGRPSLALVCGSQEIEEQAAMTSIPRARWDFPVLERVIPDLVDELLPGVPYATSNPTGGTVPYQMNAGVSHYFGIGGYLRPVEDARRAGVRFASECLAFATPPEHRTVDEECGGSHLAGHDPGWKLAVHHDAGRSWDLEDMQGFYVRQLYGVDPFALRYRDAELALDLGRATVATLFEVVLSEWRRPGSTCSGAIVLALRDLRPGAGWGVIDSLGRPKAPWYALKRVLAPVGLLLTDEGLNGLDLHVVNDTASEVAGTVRVDLFVRGELMVESAEQRVVVAGRSATTIEVTGMFDGFRDLSGAFSFTPPAHDVVSATFVTDSGTDVPVVVHQPGGAMRPIESDVGLRAQLVPTDDAGWLLEIETKRFAEWVVVDVPGYRPDDSWFHLPPGAKRKLRLHPEIPQLSAQSSPLSGEVRALNSASSARFAAPN
ncbi:MAG: glycoside hydrolase family 2 protein [Acidimicrobiales bacterium]